MKSAVLFLIANLLIISVYAQLPDTIQRKVKSKVVNGTVMSTDKNIIQNVSQSKDYSTLLAAISTAGLTETFESKGPITFFAPTNEAFEKLPAGKMDSLLRPDHKYELSSLITYHAIAGRVTVRDMERNIKEHNGTAVYITLAGGKLYASIDASRNIVLTDENGRQTLVNRSDVEQRNGMLHVINEVFIPKHRMI